MRKFLIAAFAAATFSLPARAADISMDTVLGSTMSQVKASLVKMGYDVRKSEVEDGLIEVYFVKDRTRGEVYVNPKTGRPAKLKIK